MPKSVLLITSILPHYRVPLFEMLAVRYRLTVAHSNDPVPNTVFKQVRIGVRYKGGFEFHDGLPSLERFDVVIIPFNLRMLTMYRLLHARRPYRLLIFGIGVSASYDSQYDRDKRLDFLRRWWIRKSDGAIFYEHYPMIKFQSQGLPAKKLFVAYNTIEPMEDFRFESRSFERFTFIGSLYKQKRIFELLEAYRKVVTTIGESVPPLDVIGDGSERLEIESWIARNGLQSKIVIHGQVSDTEKLAPILQRSIACISPGQAGLSVQRCFSFGVPFVTTRTAITGGELFSVIPGVTGFLYEGSVDSLANLMKKLISENAVTAKVARNAWEFYSRYRHPAIWVDGFVQAIDG